MYIDPYLYSFANPLILYEIFQYTCEDIVVDDLRYQQFSNFIRLHNLEEAFCYVQDLVLE
jgi:hypothetical protein